MSASRISRQANFAFFLTLPRNGFRKTTFLKVLFFVFFEKELPFKFGVSEIFWHFEEWSTSVLISVQKKPRKD